MSLRTLCSSVARACTPPAIKRKAAVAFAALSLSTGCIDKVGVGNDNDSQDSGRPQVQDSRPSTQDGQPETQDAMSDSANSTSDAGARMHDTGLTDARTEDAQADGGIDASPPCQSARLESWDLFKTKIWAEPGGRQELQVLDNGTCNESEVVFNSYPFTNPDFGDFANPFTNGVGAVLNSGVAQGNLPPEEMRKFDISTEQVVDLRGTQLSANTSLFIAGSNSEAGHNHVPALDYIPALQIKFDSLFQRGIDFANENNVRIPLTIAGFSGAIVGFNYGPLPQQREEVTQGGWVDFEYETNGEVRRVRLENGQPVVLDEDPLSAKFVMLTWRRGENDLPLLRSIVLHDFYFNQAPSSLFEGQKRKILGTISIYNDGLLAEEGNTTLTARAINNRTSFSLGGGLQVALDSYLALESQDDLAFVTPQGAGNLLVASFVQGQDMLLIGRTGWDSYYLVSPEGERHVYAVRFSALGLSFASRDDNFNDTYVNYLMLVPSPSPQGFALGLFEDAGLGISQGHSDILGTAYVSGQGFTSLYVLPGASTVYYSSPFNRADALTPYEGPICGIAPSTLSDPVGRFPQGHRSHRGTELVTDEAQEIDLTIPRFQPATLKWGIEIQRGDGCEN